MLIISTGKDWEHFSANGCEPWLEYFGTKLVIIKKNDYFCGVK